MRQHNRTISRVHPTLLWICLSAVIIVAASTAWIAHKYLPSEDQPAFGLYIGGRLLPANQSLGEWLEQRRRVQATERIMLLDGLDGYEMSLGELGIEMDIPGTMRAALAVGRNGSILDRARTLREARSGYHDVPIRYSVDENRAQVELDNIAKHVRREPINAYENLSAHERVAEVPGVELDVHATLASIVESTIEGERKVLIRTKPVPANVTLDDLSNVDITKVVASFETTFATWGEGRGRSRNIQLAAAAIDATVLKPGQSFLFNTVVGHRTREKGYVFAPVIIGDEIEPGVGGGVCQVASTLYAAALHAAMQITERWSHSRPSGYTRLGLDATISYPSKDLRFVNVLPFPVILHLYFPEKGKLRAEILGGDPVATVSYKYWVSKTKPFVRRIVPDSSLPSMTARRKQRGIQGYSVVSLVEVNYGTHTDTRMYSSFYRPTPEIFRISADYDIAGLPELPKGASGVEDKAGESLDDVEPAG